MPSIPFIVADGSLLTIPEKKQLKELQKAMESDKSKAVEDKLVATNIRLLMERSKDCKGCLLHFAARYNCSEIVRVLVSTYPKAVIETNCKGETPIFIAIEHDKLESVRKMFHHFRNQIRENKIEELPGNSLVHAVLKHCSHNWEGYLEVLFANDNDDKLNQMLSESHSEMASPLSWVLLSKFEEETQTNEKLAINVMKKYPKLLELQDKYDDHPFPVHQAVIEGKFNFLVECIEVDEKYCLKTNDRNCNIFHLLALKEHRCQPQIFNYLKKLNGIYDLVRREGKFKCSPLELAAANKDIYDVGKGTNDEFIKFAVSDEVKKSTPNLTDSGNGNENNSTKEKGKKERKGRQ